MALVQLASDNFNRADVAPLPSPWNFQSSGSFAQLGIISNQVVPNLLSGQQCSQWYGTITWPNDQWSQMTAVHQVGPSSLGPIVRAQSGAVKTNYNLLANNTNLYIGKFIAGSWTQLATVLHTFADNDVLLLTVIGTALTGYLNGTPVLSATDSDLTSGNAGIYMSESTGALHTLGDAWSGGSMGTPTQAGAFLVGF